MHVVNSIQTQANRIQGGVARPPYRFIAYLLEIALIGAWAAYIGRVFLGAGRLQLNNGGDNVSAYGRFFWNHVASCGTCALWGSEVRGGAPAYIDINADTFHPAVAIPALLFGTLDGFKITIVLCLFLGGVACWWLGLELGVSCIARVAAGFMGVTGGYLTGRSYQGLVVVITSIAAASFIVPAVLRLVRLPTRRSAGLLGIVLGLFALSGQGYLQVGLLMMSPIFLILVFANIQRWRTYLLRSIESLVVGMLIGGVVLFPFLRYYSQFNKESDSAFSTYQTLRYLVLNLVINDWDYFHTDKLLDKQPLPGIYVNYLGWAVIILAVFGGIALWQRSKPVLLTLVLVILAALWIGSGAPFELLGRPWWPSFVREFAVSVRNPTFIAAAAAPPIIGLAAVGVDAGLRWSMRVTHQASELASHPWVCRGASVAVRAGTILLLLLGLRNLERAADQWLAVEGVTPERAATFLRTLETDELAWVAPPLSDWILQMIGFDHGLKYSDGWRPWSIEGMSEQPAPFIALKNVGDAVPDGMAADGQNEVGQIYRRETGNLYATVDTGGTCVAQGEAGDIYVACESPTAGTLIVQENAFSGWEATVNGKQAGVTTNGQWIAVAIPPGTSTIEFRYRPWDFWVGLALSSIGLLLAAVMISLPARVHFSIRWPVQPSNWPSRVAAK